MREKIRPIRHRAARRRHRNQSRRRGNAGRDVRRRCLRLGWPQTMLLLWLAVTIALVAVVLILNRDSRNGPCTESWGAVVCAHQAPGVLSRTS